MRRAFAAWVLVGVLCGCGATVPGSAATKPSPAAVGSAGCAKPAPVPGTLRLNVDGRSREAVVRYNADIREPRPLFLLFHGYGDRDAAGMERDTGFAERAARGDMIAVYPRALGDPPSWDFADGVDLAFVDRLIKRLEDSLCVDTSRVFVAGMSQGGGMADLVACRMAKEIAAAASVAAVYAPNYGGQCTPQRPVPVLGIHAIDDPVVPYEGGRVVIGPTDELPPVIATETWANNWAHRNGCDLRPLEQVSGAVHHLHWVGCDADVELYRLDEDQHAWPGGPGDAGSALNASELIWEFFSHQALQPVP